MDFFDASYVRKNLTMLRCISLMREALEQLESGVNQQNVRTGIALKQGGLAFMPCMLGARKTFGAKIISVYPGNRAKKRPSHQGQVLLFDEETGTPIASADAEAITEIRTAAASALATDLLSKKDAHVLAIFGSGAQAKSHLEAMCCVRDIQEVHVWSHTYEHACAFVETMKRQYPTLTFMLCDTPAGAAQGAEILCCVSHSTEPYLTKQMVQDGAHINAVGTCSPTSREIASDLVAVSKLYGDQIEACKVESGEYLIPLKEGVIQEDHLLGTIGGLLVETVRGRTSEKDITIFDSLGLAVEDVICVDDLWREAKHT